MVTSEGAGSRVERRKAQTRSKLVLAARSLLASGAAQQVSIQGITEAADVGLGSFYNHFAGKAELFDAAVEDALEEAGTRLDELSQSLDDPAAAFGQSVRLVARLALTQPALASVLAKYGMAYVGASRGLAPRVRRDLELGVARDRFVVGDLHMTVVAIAGALFATMHDLLTDPPQDPEGACDDLGALLLQMLGVAPGEARRLAGLPLPELASP